MELLYEKDQSKSHLLHFAVVFGGCGNVGITRFYDAPAVQPIVLTFTHAVKHHVCYFLIVFVGRQTDLEEKSKNVFSPVLNPHRVTHTGKIATCEIQVTRVSRELHMLIFT